MRIAIVEDEPEVREMLISYVGRYEREKGCSFETAVPDGLDFISDYKAPFDIFYGYSDAPARRNDRCQKSSGSWMRTLP